MKRQQKLRETLLEYVDIVTSLWRYCFKLVPDTSSNDIYNNLVMLLCKFTDSFKKKVSIH